VSAMAKPPVSTRMPTAEERLAKLEQSYAAQTERLDEAERIIKAIGAVFTGGVGGDIAEDDDLDGKFGNEPIRKNPTPTYWKGPSYIGKRFSECPPEYLDALAKYKDVCAKLTEKGGDASKKKFVEYDRRDAARARGWAKRLRAGWTAPEKPSLNAWSAAPLGGPAGFSHTPFGGAPAFGGSSNPFAKSPPAKTTTDDALFGADRPTDKGDAYEPEDDALGLPGGDDSFPTGESEQSGSRPVASVPNRIELDDDDDDLPVGGAGR